MVTEQDKILINKYIDYELTPEEELEFERRVEDPQFRGELYLFSEVNSILLGDLELIEGGQEEPLKDLLDMLGGAGEYDVNNTQKRLSLQFLKPYHLKVAIAAAFLIGALGYWEYNSYNQFSAYAQGYIDNENPSPSQASIDDGVMSKAHVLFKERKYIEVIDLLGNPAKENEVEDSKELTYNYYLGSSYLKTGSMPEAIEALSKIKPEDDLSKFELAKWYLCLAYLQTGNTEAAKQIVDFLVVLNDLEGLEQAEIEKINEIRKKLNNQ